MKDCVPRRINSGDHAVAGGDASVPIDPLVAQQQNTMKVSGGKETENTQIYSFSSRKKICRMELGVGRCIDNTHCQLVLGFSIVHMSLFQCVA